MSKVSESGFAGFNDYQDVFYPVHSFILPILIQTIEDEQDNAKDRNNGKTDYR